MSRIHLITDSPIGSALAEAGWKAFDFDLFESVAALTCTGLRSRVLSRLAFACDAYINIAIQRALSDFRGQQEQMGAAPWDSYQAFLHYASGLATSEETMREAGMQVANMHDACQKLFTARTFLHELLAVGQGSEYEVPSLEEFIGKPRLRRDDPATLLKLKNTFRTIASDDDGVIDVDLEKQLADSYAETSAFQKQDQLKWDKQRGELAVQFLRALRLRDDLHVEASIGQRDALEGVTDAVADPFGDLDAIYQRKLLDGSIRYIQNSLTDMASDRKVDYVEHAACAVESRPLLKAIRTALGHPKMLNALPA